MGGVNAVQSESVRSPTKTKYSRPAEKSSSVSIRPWFTYLLQAIKANKNLERLKASDRKKR